MAGAIDVDRALVVRCNRFIGALRRLRFDGDRRKDGLLRPRRLDFRRRIQSRGAGSLSGAVSRIAGAADCRTSLASASMRRIATPMANVTTAAATPTAPASAYSRPRPSGNRSRLW